MGIEVEKKDTEATVGIKVLVQFQQSGGTVYQGDFVGEFKRVDQARIDDFLDEEQGWRNSDVLDEILVGVSGITRGGVEMPPDEQLKWVRQTPECVNAAVTAFFRITRPERYNERTSKKRRGRG
jgi:hypothetical protein